MNQHPSNYGRIIAVLDAVIADTDPRGVRQLSELTGVARSTVGRILQLLAGAEVMEPTGNGEYQTGPRLQILMHALRRRHPLLQAIRERAHGLAHRASSTAVLSIFDPVQVRAFIVFTYRHSGPAEYTLNAGTLIPLHAGSVGQAIVMSVGNDVLNEMILEPFTANTIVSLTELENRLSESRNRGYTISTGQHIELAAGAAVPFRAYGMTGSVSVSGPKYSTTENDLHHTGQALTRTVRDIETAAGNQALPVSEPVVNYPAGSTSVARFLRLVTLIIAALPGEIRQGPKLAAALGANVATTRNLLQSLSDYGLVSRSENMVSAGPLLFLWSSRVTATRSLAEYAEPFLRALSAETGETVGLAEYDARTEQADTVRVLRGPRPSSYGLSSGGSVPLHAGALGKAILANCPPELLDRLRLERYTERTICTRAQLCYEVNSINSLGYATADSERMPDAYGIGAPIFQDGVITGSIAVTIARVRRDSVDIETLAAQVRTTARALTQLLSIESAVS